MRWIVIPYWFLIATTAIAPFVAFRRTWRRRRRRGENQCAACGYDLRATPDRCPECGTVPAVPAGSP
jgi:hypothetical protein